MTTTLDDTDKGIVYGCPTDALSPGWLPFSDALLVGGTGMYTRGNFCYMEYTFTGTGISIFRNAYADHGTFGCSINGSTPQWFNAWNGGTYNLSACTISSLQNARHTVRVINGPIPLWILTVDWLWVTTAGPSVDRTPIFTSNFPSFDQPSYIYSAYAGITPSSTATTSQSASMTSTTTSQTMSSSPSPSPSGEIPVAALATVASILGTAVIFLLILSIYLSKKARKLKAKVAEQTALANTQAIQPYQTVEVSAITPTWRMDQNAGAQPVGQTFAQGGLTLSGSDPSPNSVAEEEFNPYGHERMTPKLKGNPTLMPTAYIALAFVQITKTPQKLLQATLLRLERVEQGSCLANRVIKRLSDLIPGLLSCSSPRHPHREGSQYVYQMIGHLTCKLYQMEPGLKKRP